MAVRSADPKRPINPNWAQLQQKLKKGESKRTKLTKCSKTDSDSNNNVLQSVLGKRKERPELEPDSTHKNNTNTNTNVLIPNNSDFSLTDVIAMDCEMVGVSSQGNKSALARVTVVNAFGNVLYDEYVRPLERVVDFRSAISGIRPYHLKKAKGFQAVQKKVAELLKGRILVGHALHNDLKALMLSHPKKDTRDTSEYQPLLSTERRRRALRDLAAEYLGVKIQEKEHCPIDDARAAMLIYQKHKKEWERIMKKQLQLKEKHKNRKRKRQSKESNSTKPNHSTIAT